MQCADRGGEIGRLARAQDSPVRWWHSVVFQTSFFPHEQSGEIIARSVKNVVPTRYAMQLQQDGTSRGSPDTGLPVLVARPDGICALCRRPIPSVDGGATCPTSMRSGKGEPMPACRRHAGCRPAANAQSALPQTEVTLYNRYWNRATETSFELAECFSGREKNSCRIAGACELTQVLETALQTFLGVLDRHTLADLLSPAPALKGTLMVEQGNA